MRRTVASTLLAISLIMSVSCASESSEPGVFPSPGLPSQSTQTAQQAAESLQPSVQTVVRVIPIDEDNDPNALIGRPTGYIAATALVDSRTDCETVDGKPATDCGAVIEQWPSQAAAEKRKAYIDGVLEAAPVLGTEYSTVKGPLLLRVTGGLKPSQAKEYETAFTG